MSSAPPRGQEGRPDADPTRRETPASPGRHHRAPGPGDALTRRERPAARRTRRLHLPQTVASRYEYLHDLQAAGGEADLALLRDRTSGAEVVFKSYRAGMAPDPVAMEILRTADPRHVVRLIEVHDGADGAWEIQEHCPLGSLRDWVASRGGRLRKSVLTDVVRGVAGALQYIHGLDSGVAHRDIKPSNVLVRSEERLELVLTDFGLAKAGQSITHLTTTAKGTWHYAAPEVHAKQSSAKSDWFSLGAMIYEFYTGRQLFAMDDGTEVTEDDAKARCMAGNYSTDLIDDPRWKLLADGLLTWDKDHRWGADQVEAWLRGESPAVRSERATPNRTVGYRPHWSPTLVSSPEELADQLRRHWGAAAAELAGRPDPRMVRFLEGFPGFDDALRIIKSSDAPGPKLVRIQGILDPGGKIHYESVPLDDASLREQIRAASLGDSNALDWLQSILNEHILTAYAEVTGSQEAARADYLLTRWASQADDTMKPLPRDYQELARTEFRAALPELFTRALGGGALPSAQPKPGDSNVGQGAADAPQGGRRSIVARVFGRRRSAEAAASPAAGVASSASTSASSAAADKDASVPSSRESRARQRSAAEAGQPSPETIVMTIPRNKIGAVIGSGGITVKKLQNDTGTHISIEDDGRVTITATNVADAQKAREAIQGVIVPAPPVAVATKPRVGERYRGTVQKTVSFGAFISHPSGKDGLLHITKLRPLAGDRWIEDPSDVVHHGQQLDVEVIDIKANGEFSLALVACGRSGRA